MRINIHDMAFYIAIFVVGKQPKAGSSHIFTSLLYYWYLISPHEQRFARSVLTYASVQPSQSTFDGLLISGCVPLQTYHRKDSSLCDTMIALSSVNCASLSTFLCFLNLGLNKPSLIRVFFLPPFNMIPVHILW